MKMMNENNLKFISHVNLHDAFLIFPGCIITRASLFILNINQSINPVYLKRNISINTFPGLATNCKLYLSYIWPLFQ